MMAHTGGGLTMTPDTSLKARRGLGQQLPVPDAVTFLHHPTPGPWDEALATALVRSTADAIAHRLGWTMAWDEWAAQQVPADYKIWEEALNTINTAWRSRDRVAVAKGCIAWWRVSRAIAAARSAMSVG